MSNIYTKIQYLIVYYLLKFIKIIHFYKIIVLK